MKSMGNANMCVPIHPCGMSNLFVGVLAPRIWPWTNQEVLRGSVISFFILPLSTTTSGTVILQGMVIFHG